MSGESRWRRKERCDGQKLNGEGEMGKWEMVNAALIGALEGLKERVEKKLKTMRDLIYEYCVKQFGIRVGSLEMEKNRALTCYLKSGLAISNRKKSESLIEKGTC